VSCAYNANGLPDPILEGVWQTRPEVGAGDTWMTSDHYEDPNDLLHRITRIPEPLSELRSIAFGRDPEEFRGPGSKASTPLTILGSPLHFLTG
jgi:hypothetical protein